MSGSQTDVMRSVKVVILRGYSEEEEEEEEEVSFG